MTMRLVFLSTVLALLGTALAAHEFWISPERYQIDPGDTMMAELRVGENLSGAGYPYIPARAQQHYIMQNGQPIAPGTRMGDRPAMSVTLDAPGLAILVHETADSILTYREWEKFEAFTNHKDLAWAQEAHRTRGLPDTGFRESYRRYGKALVGVGHAQGRDLRLGLLTEIVALANPYTDPLPDGLPVQVFAYGAPRADAQVELFARPADGEVTSTFLRTNAQGIVLLPVEPGVEYLADSVLLESRSPAADGDPVWHSAWASLAFRMPDRRP